jgi:biopolymer transport protein ExbB/TolQ
MALFFNPKFWVALVAAAILSFVLFFVYRAGKAAVRTEWDAEKIAQLERNRESERENRNIESARSRNVADAQAKALQRVAAAKDDALAARSTADGLRDDLAAAQRDLSRSSIASCRQHASTLNTVFAECTRSVEGLAGAAQGHASDSLMLQDAWPKK